MWLIFVLIIVGIVFGFQRKNINLFSQTPSGNVNQTTPAKTPPATTPAPAPAPTPATAKPPALRLGLGQVYSTQPAQEYIVLEHFDFDNKQAISISGMKLQNRDRVSGTVGKNEYGGDIYLNYGERAAIVTGESPLGKNFKLNKCSGYFNQNNSLPVYTSCPSLSDLPQPRNLNNKCIQYIESLPNCAVPNINADTGIDNTCAEFVIQHASYVGCVADHKNDTDFDQRHWLIYLGKNAEMWGSRRDLIQLFDQLGKLIAEISY
ncbi:hypothetical protein A2661_02005 [Candidatus Giovannonibacteria bacterium RIFCSPHIGHO2_01_FULL_45_24]|nr:MAG: hypothetical protein A2661_02005 [Candidatus Giovannonibacteria bacterium RIFCSPHIGHO2_01_FULL_45_24]